MNYYTQKISCNKAIEAYYIEGLTDEEIAYKIGREYGFSENYVKKIIKIIDSVLKKKIQETKNDKRTGEYGL